MKFSEAYSRHGPDTLAISKALEIPEHEAESLIYDHMNKIRDRRRSIKLSLDAKAAGGRG